MSETIQTKRCTRCKEVKSLTEFYRDKIKLDGHSSQCKICNINRIKVSRQTERGRIMSCKVSLHYRQKHPERHKTSQKHYRHTEKGRTFGRVSNLRIRLFHPEKWKARRAVQHAVQAGKIVPVHTLNCRNCQQKAQEYHHYLGYEPEFWFIVMPLCKRCHRLIHK